MPGGLFVFRVVVIASEGGVYVGQNHLLDKTTAILIIIEGRETVLGGFVVPVYYWKTVE